MYKIFLKRNSRKGILFRDTKVTSKRSSYNSLKQITWEVGLGGSGVGYGAIQRNYKILILFNF